MASYNEFFNYGQSLTPMPFSIEGVEEIVDPPYHEVHHNMDYGNYNNPTNRHNGQVQYYEQRQFYFDEHDHRRSRNHNDRGEYTRNPIPFQMDQQELPGNQISVTAQLSNPSININDLRSALSRNYEAVDCHLEDTNRGYYILTVTGDLRIGSYGSENDFLTIVRHLTGASVVRRS